MNKIDSVLKEVLKKNFVSAGEVNRINILTNEIVRKLSSQKI